MPKLIKVKIKGRSLTRVIGPWRLPITRWVGIVQDRRIPFMRSCKVYSWVPLQILISGFTNDIEIHESTSASQWRSIAVNGADPLFSTYLDRPIIYRVFEPFNLSRGMDGVPFPQQAYSFMIKLTMPWLVSTRAAHWTTSRPWSS